jgi:hypothetical protein
MSSPLAHIEVTRPLSFVTETKFASLLHHLKKKPQLARLSPASRLEIRPAPDTASSGIRQIDALTGGLPRGCLTEVSGPDSSGRTSLMLSALAAATRREEICTLIDATDTFDPHSAAAAGVNLERLLWVRCGSHAQSSALSRKRRPAASLEEWERRRMEDPVEQALRATDLLLQSSGFGMVAIDLAGAPLKMARRIPLTTWFRFRRAVENTPTVLLVIGTHPCAQSCTSLLLQLKSHQSPDTSQDSAINSRFLVHSERPCSNDNDSFNQQHPSHAELLTGMEIQAELIRSRTERKPVQSANTAFQTRAAWTG